MSVVVELLAGVVVAALIFAATIFAAAQAYRQSGALKWAQLAAALLTVAAMGCLSWELWRAAQVAGAALAVAALAAIILERRWNRVLPLAHLGFAAALVAGLPFGGID